MVTKYLWNAEKNDLLIRQRGLSFDMVLEAIDAGNLLDDIPHPDVSRYPNQRMLQIEIKGYACAVPYVADGEVRFLKTIYPSRRVKRLHSGE